MFELVYHREQDGSTRVDGFITELKAKFNVEATLMTDTIRDYHIVRVSAVDFKKITGWHKELAWQEMARG